MPYEPKKKKVMEKFRLDEVSFVRRPAQGLALADIAKSDDAVLPDITKGGIIDTATVKDDTGHQHGINVTHDPDGAAHIYLSYAGEGESGQHSHDVIMTADGTFMITENFGHDHEIDEAEIRRLIMAVLTKAEFEIPEEADIAVLLSLWDQNGDDSLQKDGEMPDDVKKGADDLKKAQDAVTKAEGQRDAAVAENAVLKAVSEMNDVEKAFYEKLDKEDDKKRFRDAGRKERMEKMGQANDADPVVYKSERTGAQFRKSDDPRMIDIAKAADEDHAELVKARTDAEEASFKKTAEDDLAKMAGDVDVRTAIVKAVQKSDESDEMKDKMMQALKSHAGDMSKATTTLGKDGLAKSDEEGTISKKADAEAELERVTKELQEKDSALGYYDAYEKACELHPEVYKTAIGGAA